MNGKLTTCVAAFAILTLVGAPADAQSLRGSPSSVDLIYRQAVNHQLRFFESSAAIRNAAQRGELMRLAENADFSLADVSYPYVQPATHTFVLRLAAQYRAACGEKLVVTSATRPTSMRLANSVDKSVHPTGMAVDLRKPQNGRCLSWLRNTLTAIEASGVIDAVEERNPPHFHVAVFPNPYGQYVQGRTGGSGQLASTATRAAAPAPSSAATQAYRVRSGDSLWTIARRNNLTVDTLKEANDLSSSRILAGQVLQIPVAR